MSRLRARGLHIAAFGALLASGVYAASPIEWSKDYKLKPEDFRQRAPATATDAAHSFVGVEVAWECGETAEPPYARAIFDPEQSWWRGTAGNVWGSGDAALSRSQLEYSRSVSQRESDLLRHEQLHFDLTELTARKIRSLLTRLAEVCLDGTVEEEIRHPLSELERLWLDEQARYDSETGNGTVRGKQLQWEQRIQRELAKN
jgi:hypothetical protein